jgi:hypothetical protein
MDLCRFGDMVQKSPEMIINYLVGIVILSTGLEQSRHTACTAGLSGADLARLSTALSMIGPVDAGFVRGIKTEFKVTCRTTDDIGSGRIKLGDVAGNGSPKTLRNARIPGYLFQPNKTKALFAGFFRNIIRNASRSYAEREESGIEKYVAEQKRNKLKFFVGPNSIGRILFMLVVPAFDKISEMKCRLDCDLAATRIIVACHAFRRSTGAFPVSLDDLVPGYLGSVPRDPFDGKPFRYSREKGIVYAVGKDLADSGGMEEPLPAGEHPSGSSRWRASDYVFHLNGDTPLAGAKQ